MSKGADSQERAFGAEDRGAEHGAEVSEKVKGEGLFELPLNIAQGKESSSEGRAIAEDRAWHSVIHIMEDQALVGYGELLSFAGAEPGQVEVSISLFDDQGGELLGVFVDEVLLCDAVLQESLLGGRAEVRLLCGGDMALFFGLEEVDRVRVLEPVGGGDEGGAGAVLVWRDPEGVPVIDQGCRAIGLGRGVDGDDLDRSGGGDFSDSAHLIAAQGAGEIGDILSGGALGQPWSVIGDIFGADSLDRRLIKGLKRGTIGLLSLGNRR